MVFGGVFNGVFDMSYAANMHARVHKLPRTAGQTCVQGSGMGTVPRRNGSHL